eukprot:GDKJ01059398.1.p1 GENE.GDKJ01059398.1~~GDKJ01059398.1.p1  ORF type:complete len:830 (+),score=209.80 GDKJ01059398.1:2-2491(+)
MGRSKMISEQNVIRPHRNPDKAREYVSTVADVVYHRYESTPIGSLSASLRGLGVLYARGLLDDAVAQSLVDDVLPHVISKVHMLHPNELADLMHSCGNFSPLFSNVKTPVNKSNNPASDGVNTEDEDDELVPFFNKESDIVSAPSLYTVREHLHSVLCGSRPKYVNNPNYHDFIEDPTDRYLSSGHLAAILSSLRVLCPPHVARKYSRFYKEGEKEEFPFIDAILNQISLLKREHGEQSASLLSLCFNTIASMGVADHPIVPKLLSEAVYMLKDEKRKLVEDWGHQKEKLDPNDWKELDERKEKENAQCAMKLIQASLSVVSQRVNSSPKIIFSSAVDPRFISEISQLITKYSIYDSPLVSLQVLQDFVPLVNRTAKFTPSLQNEDQKLISSETPACRENKKRSAVGFKSLFKQNELSIAQSEQSKLFALQVDSESKKALTNYESNEKLNMNALSVSPSSDSRDPSDVTIRAARALMLKFENNRGVADWGMCFREKARSLSHRLGHENGRVKTHVSDGNYSVELFFSPEKTQKALEICKEFQSLKERLLHPFDAMHSLVNGKRTDEKEMERQRDKMHSISQRSYKKELTELSKENIPLSADILNENSLTMTAVPYAAPKPLQGKKKQNLDLQAEKEWELAKQQENEGKVIVLQTLPGVAWTHNPVEHKEKKKTDANFYKQERNHQFDHDLEVLKEKERLLAQIEREALKKQKKRKEKNQNNADEINSDVPSKQLEVKNLPLEGPMSRKWKNAPLDDRADWQSQAWSAVSSCFVNILKTKDALQSDQKLKMQLKSFVDNSGEIIQYHSNTVTNEIFAEVIEELDRTNEKR